MSTDRPTRAPLHELFSGQTSKNTDKLDEGIEVNRRHWGQSGRLNPVKRAAADATPSRAVTHVGEGPGGRLPSREPLRHPGDDPEVDMESVSDAASEVTESETGSAPPSAARRPCSGRSGSASATGADTDGEGGESATAGGSGPRVVGDWGSSDDSNAEGAIADTEALRCFWYASTISSIAGLYCWGL